MLFKIEGAGSIASDASTSLSRLNARLLDQEVDQSKQPFTSKPTALSARGRGNACVCRLSHKNRHSAGPTN